jgi:hypothetical protein
MALVLLAFLRAAPPARADIPWLSVRLVGGETASYPVNDLNRINFEGDTLVVVHAGGTGTDRYGAATVARIEFLWSPADSGVVDPRDAAALVKAVHLFQNQPNPFSPAVSPWGETSIAFDLPKAGPVELVIYGVNGRLDAGWRLHAESVPGTDRGVLQYCYGCLHDYDAGCLHVHLAWGRGGLQRRDLPGAVPARHGAGSCGDVHHGQPDE